MRELEADAAAEWDEVKIKDQQIRGQTERKRTGKKPIIDLHYPVLNLNFIHLFRKQKRFKQKLPDYCRMWIGLKRVQIKVQIHRGKNVITTKRYHMSFLFLPYSQMHTFLCI